MNNFLELKPCPFCNREATITKVPEFTLGDNDCTLIVCGYCRTGQTGVPYHTELDAVLAWNKRLPNFDFGIERTDISSCPFCGGKADARIDTILGVCCVRVECNKCEASQARVPAGIEYNALDVAIAAWNRRVSDVATKEATSMTHRQ